MAGTHPSTTTSPIAKDTVTDLGRETAQAATVATEDTLVRELQLAVL